MNMAGKKKTYRDYPTVFQITRADKDKYVLLGVLTEKQLGALMHILYEEFEPKTREWRGQYQALARAIIEAYESMEKH
jgi:hypothetical protein